MRGNILEDMPTIGASPQPPLRNKIVTNILRVVFSSQVLS
jgi:hypothetical protein